ncbi:MAG: hypothetical protein ACAH83_07855 [Alphaproteobacteria bacterium]
MLIGNGALAAPPPAAGSVVEGCDQRVLDAAQAKARSLVIYDWAMAEETIDKPDSQLALTCFNNIAGVAANEGGTIFSGPLTGHWWATGVTYPYDVSNPPVWTSDTYYTTDIEDALNGFYDEFTDAMGNDGGTVDYTQTTITDTAACSEEQNLWGDPPGGTPTPQAGSVRGEGVQGGVPFLTEDDIRGISQPGGAGTDYLQEIGQDAADISAYDTAQQQLEPANIKPVTPPFPNGVVQTGAYNSCNVLLLGGVATSCP